MGYQENMQGVYERIRCVFQEAITSAFEFSPY